MRFLADESVSGLIINTLRESGFNVYAITERQPGSPDSVVLSLASANDCILITEDKDFGELVIRQQVHVLGVLLLELDQLSNDAEADRVRQVVLAHADRFEGALVVVEPGRLRIRPLKPPDPPEPQSE